MNVLDFKNAYNNGEFSISDTREIIGFLRAVAPEFFIKGKVKIDCSVKSILPVNALHGKEYGEGVMDTLITYMDANKTCGKFATRKQWGELGRAVKVEECRVATVAVPYKKGHYSELYAYEQTEAV